MTPWISSSQLPATTPYSLTITIHPPITVTTPTPSPSPRHTAARAVPSRRLCSQAQAIPRTVVAAAAQPRQVARPSRAKAKRRRRCPTRTIIVWAPRSTCHQSTSLAAPLIEMLMCGPMDVASSKPWRSLRCPTLPQCTHGQTLQPTRLPEPKPKPNPNPALAAMVGAR